MKFVARWHLLDPSAYCLHTLGGSTEQPGIFALIRRMHGPLVPQNNSPPIRTRLQEEPKLVLWAQSLKRSICKCDNIKYVQQCLLGRRARGCKETNGVP